MAGRPRREGTSRWPQDGEPLGADRRDPRGAGQRRRVVALRLKTLLGEHPVSAALKSGALRSPGIEFDFADVKVPNTAFKRVVRSLDFDIAELAIATYLMAKAAGKPLILLPAVIVARMQHSLLVRNTERGPLAPADLAGRRVGVRSYSVTTGMWVRAILEGDFGVDLERITWVTFEDAHVAEFRDPPNVERAPAGRGIEEMLLAGEIDAAVVGRKPEHARLQPLIADVAGAEAAWRRRTGAIQINHMVAARDTLPPATLREVYRLFDESRRAAGEPEMNPFGLAANRRNLEVAIECAYRQKLIARRFEVGELFGGHFS